MPKPTYQGTNSQGNNYTNYDNGAYRYNNVNPETGKSQGNYYNTGDGHAFYRQNQAAAPGGGKVPGSDYSWHENQNQGTRTYIEKSSGGAGKSGGSSGGSGSGKSSGSKSK